MTARELADKVFKRLETFDPEPILKKLQEGGANEGAIEDYLNTNGCLNYHFMSCLVDVVKPKKVLELGGAMGVGTLCLSEFLPKESDLYSITLEEHGLEFSYIKSNYIYPNIYLIVGDDLKPETWNWYRHPDKMKEYRNYEKVEVYKPEELFRKTKFDLIYIDTGIAESHSGEQLKKELDFYRPYFKKGTIIMFDDIHLNDGMNEVWDGLDWDKVDLSDPLHWTGWGLCIV